MRVVLAEDHVELLGELGGQLVEAGQQVAVADLGQRQEDDDQAAGDQQGHLDDVGQRDSLETALDLVEQSEGAEDDERDVLVDSGNLVDRDRAEPDDRGQVHEHVETEPEDRHDDRQELPISAGEELRHGVDVVLEEDRQEELADD